MSMGCINKEQAVARRVRVLEEEASLALKTNNYQIAEEKFKEILSIHPTNEHVRNNLAILYAEFIKQPDEAIKLWEQLIEEKPQNASYYNNIAGVYWQSDELHKALSFYEKAANLHKSYHMPFFNMAQIYFSLNNFSKAEEMAAKGYSIARSDTKMKLLYLKALLLNLKRNEALAILRENEQESARSPIYDLMQARILLGDSKFDEATELIEKALVNHPNNELLNMEKVEIALARDPSADTTQIFQQLEKSDQFGRLKPWYSQLLTARRQLNERKLDTAVGGLESLSEKIPSDFSYFEGLRLEALAKAYQELDKSELVAELYEKAFFFCPERVRLDKSAVEE